MFSPRLLMVCLILGLLSYGCGHKESKEESAKEESKETQEFKVQAMKFIEAGTATTAKASQGVPYADLKAQVVSTNAQHDLLIAVWPKGLAADARLDFWDATAGWDRALSLWDLKIKKADNPTEPDVNGFDSYFAVGGKRLDVQKFGKDYLVKSYRGKRYLPFDSNIKILLELAGMSFDTGRMQILKILEGEGKGEGAKK